MPNFRDEDEEARTWHETWQQEKDIPPEVRSLAALNRRLSMLEGKVVGTDPNPPRKDDCALGVSVDERVAHIEKMVGDLHRLFYGEGQQPGLKGRVDRIEHHLVAWSKQFEAQAKQFRYLWCALGVSVVVALVLIAGVGNGG